MTGIQHHFAQVNGIRLHYAKAGAGEPVLLIHGFPQTWYEWKDIIPTLARNYTVIAPDYRGAGESEKTLAGYDKRTVMEDLRALVRHLGFNKIRVVGHDMGVMVAYPYAAFHRDEVSHLVLMDAPVPGTQAMADVRSNPRAWHTNFHSVRDLPEFLVAGREREYLTAFFKARFTKPDAIPQQDIDVYVAAYSAPGGMRAAFEMYRAWEQDAADNRPQLTKKLEMPVLVLGGQMSASGPTLKKMTEDIAANGTFREVEGSGHWLCEQNPELVSRYLEEFLAG